MASLQHIIVLIVVVAIILFLLNRRKKVESEPVMASALPSETIPVFMRHDERPIVMANKVSADMVLPSYFDSRDRWPGAITPVLNQGACGSCWAFGTSSVLSDRTKIKTGDSLMKSGDYVSPQHLAACMKCPTQTSTVCKAVCSGNYVDDVFHYLRKNGAYSMNTVKAISGDSTQYICVRSKRGNPKLVKATNVFRVNPYGPSQLNNPDKMIANTRTIMHEIASNGPVTGTVQIFDPMTKGQQHQNFYLYNGGVYGTQWGSDPSSFDGYHLIVLIGFGSELVNGVQTDYWIGKNSWGKEWGMDGYFKILRGQNRAIIESDVWACTV